MTAFISIQKQKQLEPFIPWEDITCILWHQGMLLTTVTSVYNTSTGCNGKISVWNADLELQEEFQAHEYPIYAMCSGPEDTFFSCASDSNICHWQCPPKSINSQSESNESSGQYKLLNTLKGHLEPPWRLQFFGNRLYSGDELGEIRLWENDVYKGVLETFEEIWDMIVTPGCIFTVRVLDVILTTIPDGEKKACSVRNTIPGKGPLFVSGNMILCVHRTNFNIMVHSISEEKNPLIAVLSGHKAMVNAFAGCQSTLFSGDYEGKIIGWDLTRLKMLAEISLKEYGCVNTMVYSTDQNAVYVAQEKKCITKIKLIPH